jgi:hypothetical protein
MTRIRMNDTSGEELFRGFSEVFWLILANSKTVVILGSWVNAYKGKFFLDNLLHPLSLIVANLPALVEELGKVGSASANPLEIAQSSIRKER